MDSQENSIPGKALAISMKSKSRAVTSVSDRIEIASDGAGTVTWFAADGMRLVFTARTAGRWTSPSGLFGSRFGGG